MIFAAGCRSGGCIFGGGSRGTDGGGWVGGCGRVGGGTGGRFLGDVRREIYAGAGIDGSGRGGGERVAGLCARREGFVHLYGAFVFPGVAGGSAGGLPVVR